MNGSSICLAHVRIECGCEGYKGQATGDEEYSGRRTCVLEQESGQGQAYRVTAKDNQPIHAIDATLQAIRDQCHTPTPLQDVKDGKQKKEEREDGSKDEQVWGQDQEW